MRYNIEKLGKNIRTLRKQKGLSCEKLAAMTNLSTSYIGLTERGERHMVTEKLCRICEALNVSLNELVAGEFAGGEPVLKVNETAFDDILNDIIIILEEMSETQLEFMLKMAQELKSIDGTSASPEDDAALIKY